MPALKSTVGIPLIIEKVRKTADNYATLAGKDGCIVVYVRPLCEKAAKWITVAYTQNDIMDTAFIKSLKPEGEYMIKRRKALGKTLELIKISCLGMAFQKIANCARNLRKYGINRSYAAIPNIEPGENIIENGLANRKGCICYTIKKLIDEKEYDYCRIYVAVSGGESSEDEQAALGAISALEEIFPTDFNFRIY